MASASGLSRLRDDGAGELLPPVPSRARGRIEQPEVRCDREHLAEIPAAHPRGRDGEPIETATPLEVALPRAEEEQMVPADRTAERAAADRDALVGFALSKNERAFSSSWLRKKNADPLKSLVPDLVMSVTAAPPAIPCAASKLFVAMLTVSIVSAGATYITWFGSQMFTLLAPSSARVVVVGLPVDAGRQARGPACPSARSGRTSAGVAPGTRLMRAW
jgi:hypothetical protein